MMRMVTVLSILFLLGMALLVVSWNGKEDPRSESLADLRYFTGLEDNSSDLSAVYSRLDYFSISSKELESLGAISEIALTEARIFASNYIDDISLKIFDSQGNHIETVVSAGEVPFVRPVDFMVDDQRQEIHIGDTGQKKIFIFNFDGEFLRDLPVGFHFSSFNYSSKLRKYIFYVPMPHSGLDLNGNALVFFDEESLSVTKRGFPISSICQQFNPLASNRFKTFGERTFFSPPLSGSIFEIFYDGSHSKVFEVPDLDAPDVESSVRNLVSSSDDPHFLVRELKEVLPFFDFLVTDQSIILERFYHGYSHQVILDRKSDRGVVVANKIKIENFGDGFNFVFSKPRYAIEDFELVAFYVNSTCRSFHGAMEGLGGNIAEGSKLEDAATTDQDLILSYAYDFEHLYQNSTDDLSRLFPTLERDRELLDDLRIFPNPSAGDLTIEFTTPADDVSIRVVNILGGIIEERKAPGQSGRYFLNLDLSRRAGSGQYFVQIISQEGILHVEQVRLH